MTKETMDFLDALREAGPYVDSPCIAGNRTFDGEHCDDAQCVCQPTRAPKITPEQIVRLSFPNAIAIETEDGWDITTVVNDETLTLLPYEKADDEFVAWCKAAQIVVEDRQSMDFLSSAFPEFAVK